MAILHFALSTRRRALGFALALLVSGCGGGGGGSSSSPDNPDADTLFEYTYEKDAASGDQTVTLTDKVDTSKSLVVGYDAATKQLVVTIDGVPRPVPDPVPEEVAGGEDFAKVLAAVGEVAWFNAYPEGAQSAGASARMAAVTAGSGLKAAAVPETPPENCGSYLFRGDKQCTVPPSAKLVVNGAAVCGSVTGGICTPTNSCLWHDTCYYNLDDTTCSYTGNTINGQVGQFPAGKLACENGFATRVAQECGTACALAYAAGTTAGGGANWNPSKPCDAPEKLPNVGQNYCGKHGQDSCCEGVRTDSKCDGTGSAGGVAGVTGYADCACTECWKVRPPTVQITSSSCTKVSEGPNGTTTYKLVADGSVEGPVSASLAAGASGAGSNPAVLTCPNWSGFGCSRSAGNPVTTSWHMEKSFSSAQASLTVGVNAAVSAGADTLGSAAASADCGTSEVEMVVPHEIWAFAQQAIAIKGHPQGAICTWTVPGLYDDRLVQYSCDESLQTPIKSGVYQVTVVINAPSFSKTLTKSVTVLHRGFFPFPPRAKSCTETRLPDTGQGCFTNVLVEVDLMVSGPVGAGWGPLLEGGQVKSCGAWTYKKTANLDGSFSESCTREISAPRESAASFTDLLSVRIFCDTAFPPRLAYGLFKFTDETFGDGAIDLNPAVLCPQHPDYAVE